MINTWACGLLSAELVSTPNRVQCTTLGKIEATARWSRGTGIEEMKFTPEAFVNAMRRSRKQDLEDIMRKITKGNQLVAVEKAAALGNLDIVSRLATTQASKVVALMHASIHGHIPVVQSLLDHMALSPRICKKIIQELAGPRPLMVGKRYIYKFNNVRYVDYQKRCSVRKRGTIIRMLLEKCRCMDESFLGECVIHVTYEGHVNIVKILLDYGIGEIDRQIALRNAVLAGHLEMIQAVMEHGGSPPGDFKLLLQIAASYHDLNVLKRFLLQIKLTSQDGILEAMIACIRCKRYEAIRFILVHFDVDPKTTGEVVVDAASRHATPLSVFKLLLSNKKIENCDYLVARNITNSHKIVRYLDKMCLPHFDPILSNSDSECCVCYIHVPDIQMQPCKHTICSGCYRQVVHHANKCPLCRAILTGWTSV